MGQRLPSGLAAGALLVEATKQVYAAVPARETSKLRRRIVPVPAGVSPRDGLEALSPGRRSKLHPSP
jgi:hypothetical protein